MSPRSRTGGPSPEPRITAVTDDEPLAEGDLEVQPGQRLEDQRLGLRQVEPELGHLVQRPAQVDQVRADLLGDLRGCMVRRT